MSRQQVGMLEALVLGGWPVLGLSDLVGGGGVVEPGVEEVGGLGFVAGEEVAVAVEGDRD